MSLIWGTLEYYIFKWSQNTEAEGMRNTVISSKATFRKREGGGGKKQAPFAAITKAAFINARPRLDSKGPIEAGALASGVAGERIFTGEATASSAPGVLAACPLRLSKDFCQVLSPCQGFFFFPTVLCCCSTPDFVRQDRVLAGSRAKRAS